MRWHIDYWLTGEYWRFESIRSQFTLSPKDPLYTLGKGRLKRGPADLARPDPSLPRRWRFSGANFINLTDSKGPAVVVIFNDKNANGDTVIKIASWWLNDTITPGFQPITIADIYSGLTEECMGIDPDAVIGIYFAPFMPISTNNPKTHQYLSLTYGWYETQSGQGNVAGYWASSDYYQTNDAIKWVVLDPLGTTYATLPWHVKFNSIESKIDIGTSGASLILTFLDTAESYPHQHLAEGRRVQIPLISAPVTSNAMASYVLSGKQEYDRAMATIQQEQNFKSGIANAGTGAIGGAIAGSAASPGLGTVAGLVGGAASSVLGSYISGEVQKETDRKSFEALDKYTSNQTSSVIISAGGTAWVSSTSKWMIVGLTRDAESAAELSAEQSNLGYVTDSYKADCTAVVALGGGLRIEGLEVKGNISPEGKTYIVALFARGVHLDLIQ